MNKKVSIFAERLAKMQGAAAAAMEGYTPGGLSVPDAIYIAKETCELGEAKSSGNLMVTRTFTIVDGEFKGLNIWDRIVLEKQVKDGNGQPTGEHMLSDIGIQQCRRWMEQHGLAFPDDLTQLEGVINAINDAAPTVKIRSKTTKKGDDEYINANILEVMDNIAGDASPAQAEAAPTSDTGAEAEVAQDGLSGMSRAELKAWIAENKLTAELKVTLKHTDEDVRNMIREFIANQPTEETAVEDAAPETTPEEAAAEDYTQPLLVFCASQGIAEVAEGMTQDEIVAVMLTYQYVRTEITEDELALLTAVGIPETNVIDPPAPTPPPAPKVAAPKVSAPKVGLPKPAAPEAKPTLPAAKPGLPKPGVKATVRPGLPKK
jgi:hypothetical protein